MKTITVPDIAGPRTQQCWKQAETMERCTRPLGHRGMHDWEMIKELVRLAKLLADGRAR